MKKTDPKFIATIIVSLMILAYALMPGISVHDPKVGIVNVPNWYVLYANLTTPSITQLPAYLRSKFIVLSYMAWTGK